MKKMNKYYKYVARPYVQIDKGIPLPRKKKSYALGMKRRSQTVRYPLGWMKRGDSFFTKNEQIRGVVYHFCKNHPEMKFTIRKVKNGLRVWKIK